MIRCKVCNKVCNKDLEIKDLRKQIDTFYNTYPTVFDHSNRELTIIYKGKEYTLSKYSHYDLQTKIRSFSSVWIRDVENQIIISGTKDVEPYCKNILDYIDEYIDNARE